MTEYDHEAAERRKLIRDMNDLNRRCHCGKMKVNHTVTEANSCKKASVTQTIVRRMSPQDIEKSRQLKI